MASLCGNLPVSHTAHHLNIHKHKGVMGRNTIFYTQKPLIMIPFLISNPVVVKHHDSRIKSYLLDPPPWTLWMVQKSWPASSPFKNPLKAKKEKATDIYYQQRIPENRLKIFPRMFYIYSDIPEKRERIKKFVITHAWCAFLILQRMC